MRKLQQERKAEEAQALDTAARQYVIAKERNQSFEPAANGFEFSIAEIERYLDGLSPARLASYQHSVDCATNPSHLLTISCAHESRVKAA